MRSAPAWSHLVTLPLPHAARHAAPQALEEPARRVLLRRELSARLGSGKADFDAKLLLDELPKVSFLGGEAPWDRPLPSLLCAATGWWRHDAGASSGPSTERTPLGLCGRAPRFAPQILGVDEKRVNALLKEMVGSRKRMLLVQAISQQRQKRGGDAVTSLNNLLSAYRAQPEAGGVNAVQWGEREELKELFAAYCSKVRARVEKSRVFCESPIPAGGSVCPPTSPRGLPHIHPVPLLPLASYLPRCPTRRCRTSLRPCLACLTPSATPRAPR